MASKRIVLREEKSANDYRYLGATLDDNGDLVIEGQDLGDGVQASFGCREYEWIWRIKAKDLPALERLLPNGANILEKLAQKFSNEQASQLYDFLQANTIPFEGWSRIGD